MVRCLLTLNPNKQSRPPTSVGLPGIWGAGEKWQAGFHPIGQRLSQRKCQGTVLTHFGPFLSVCSQAEEIQKHHYGMVKSERNILEIDMQISTPCSPLCSKISLPWDLGKHPSEEGQWWEGLDGSTARVFPFERWFLYYHFPVWAGAGKTKHAPTNDREANRFRCNRSVLYNSTHASEWHLLWMVLAAHESPKMQTHVTAWVPERSQIFQMGQRPVSPESRLRHTQEMHGFMQKDTQVLDKGLKTEPLPWSRNHCPLNHHCLWWPGSQAPTTRAYSIQCSILQVVKYHLQRRSCRTSVV